MLGFRIELSQVVRLPKIISDRKYTNLKAYNLSIFLSSSTTCAYKERHRTQRKGDIVSINNVRLLLQSDNEAVAPCLALTILSLGMITTA